MPLFIVVIFCLLPLAPQNVHDFHLSKCTVEYNPKDALIQISMQLFIDDLESALTELGAEKLFIGTAREHEDADQYISRYLNQRLHIEINDAKFDSINYLGKEVSEDLSSVWCYLEIPEISKVSKIYVKNGILQEIFSDQKNIVKIIGPNDQVSHFLSQIGNNEKSILYK